MDVFTHGLLGATLVQCGFQKSLGRKAILWGALAAMLPDKESQWQCRTQLPNSCAKRLIDTPIGQRFAWFSDHNYVAEILNDNLIRFHDLRFTVPGQTFQGLWGLEGKCLPQPQLHYFRHKLTFSWQRLKMLNIY